MAPRKSAGRASNGRESRSSGDLKPKKVHEHEKVNRSEEMGRNGGPRGRIIDGEARGP
jgi:hypothetical protein